MKRRMFLATPGTVSMLAATGTNDASQVVHAMGDGVHLDPVSYSQLLSRLSPDVKADYYGLGGVVEVLEKKVAEELGKETAVWLPTGTLANHLALRILSGDRRRAIVQAESHLYNDCGDCCQTLSGLNLLALAPGRATFTLAEVQQAATSSGSGRVKTPIGSIQIESPVRRRTGEVFDFGEMQKISAWAKGQGIGMHLDGARLYMAAAYTGISPAKYSSLFTTVYVSMYKYFGAAGGAVLAGPKGLLTDLFHTRRMFGGGQQEVWPYAAVALHGMEGFANRFAKAVEISEEVIRGLKANSKFEVERIQNGSNLFLLRVPRTSTDSFVKRAMALGLRVGAPRADQFVIGVNESWNRASAKEILARFEGAVS